MNAFVTKSIIVLCSTLLGFAGAAHAAPAPVYVYDFTGACTSAVCAGGTPIRAELQLTADYRPGSAITADELVFFSYDGDGLHLSIRSTAFFEFHMGGVMPQNNGAASFDIGYTVSHVPNSNWTFLNFDTSSNGAWSGGITRENGASNPNLWNAGNSGSWSLTSAPPVPEPETFAMLLFGLGLVGTVIRRRQA